MVDDAELAKRRAELEAARAALHERLPRQVRQARAGRRDAARSRTSESAALRSCRRSSKSKPARAVLEARALDREIATRARARRVVPQAGHDARPRSRHALVGNRVHRGAPDAASRSCSTPARSRRAALGVHLGMSGRVLVDDEEARAIRWSTRATATSPKWHRFGVHFADGGTFMFLRDPRRLGAVELDPDEDRLGPDAFALTLAQLDAALARSAPRRSRPCSWTSRASPVSATCSSTRCCGARASIRPAAADSLDRRRDAAPAPRDPRRRCACSAGAAARTPATSCAREPRRALPARRRAVAAPDRRRPHDVLVPGAPGLTARRYFAFGAVTSSVLSLGRDRS